MRIDQCTSNASPRNWARVARTALFVLILFTQPLGTYGSEPREMHVAPITRIAVDRSERILATVSEDKALKIWDLRTGRLIRTVHPPTGDGDVGKLFAVAIAPDGNTIVCSGYTGKKKPTSFDGQTYYEYEIYVFDVETGKLLRTLDVPVIVDHLTYSPKGDLLLATQSDKPGYTIKRPENDSTREKAVLVFKVGSYDQIDVDDQYSNYWAAVGDFDVNGRLVTVGRPYPSGYGDMSLYDSNLVSIEHRRSSVLAGVVRFSPDGRQILVARAGLEIALYSSLDLSLVSTLDLTGINRRKTVEHYPSATWSEDGHFIYMADEAMCGPQGCWIRRWSDPGNSTYQDIVAAKSPITHIASLRSGSVAFATQDGSFGTIDDVGKRTLFVSNEVTSLEQSKELSSREWTVPDVDEGQCIKASERGLLGGDLTYIPGKWMYLDPNGKVVMALPYRSVDRFSEGLASVVSGEKAGYIDKTGRLVTPIKFDLGSGDFKEGRAWARVGGDYGFIDRTGEFVIAPQFSSVREFSEGLTVVTWPSSDRHGYINTLGQTVIPAKYEHARDFHEGLAAATLDGKSGYIDKAGRWVIEPQFKLAMDFSEGLALVRRKDCGVKEEDCGMSFIDKTGRQVITNIETHYASGSFSNGRALVNDRRYVNGYIDSTGKLVIPYEIQHGTQFSEGLAAVAVSQEQWGFINPSGALVVPANYYAAGAFSDGRAQVKENKWGFVDLAGKLVIDTKYEQTWGFAEGLAPVCVSNEDLPNFQLPKTDQTATKGAVSSDSATTNVETVPIPPAELAETSSVDAIELRSIHDKVVALLRDARYAEALPLAKEGLKLIRRRPGWSDSSLVQPIVDFARAYQIVGNYRKAVGTNRMDEYRDAEFLLNRAKEIATLVKNSSIDALSLVIQLGEIKTAQTEFDAAIDLKRQEMDLLRRKYGEGHELIRRAANDYEALRVGKLLHNNDFIRALPLARANLRLARESLGTDHPNVARALTNLASVYKSSRARFWRISIALQQEALDLNAKLFGEDHWETLTSRVNLAKQYTETEQNALSKRLYQEAIDVSSKVLGTNDADVTTLLLYQADALVSLGDERSAHKALDLFNSVFDVRVTNDKWEDNRRAERALDGLAKTHRILGNYDEVLSNITQLLERSSRNGREAGFFLRQIGAVHRLKGNFVEAEKSYLKALEIIARKSTGPDKDSDTSSVEHIWGEWALEELSALSLARNNVHAARSYLDRAAQIEAKYHRRDVTWGYSFQKDDDASTAFPRDRYYTMLLQLVSQHFRNDRTSVEEALNLVLQRKMLVLDHQSQLHGRRAARPKPQQEKLEQLGAARSEVARLMLTGDKQLTDEEYFSKITLALEIENVLEREADRSDKVSGGWTFKSPSANVQELSARLPKDGALVEFVSIADIDYARHDFDRPFKGEYKYVAFILDHTGAVSLIDLGNAKAIETVVSDVQEAMRDKDSKRHKIDAALRNAFDRVWAPLSKAIGVARQITLSPDSALYALPFAALLDPQGQFLVQRFELGYVGSGRDLLTSANATVRSDVDLLLLANPDYGRQIPTNDQPVALLRQRGISEPFRSLDGTAEEARLVPPLVNGNGRKYVFVRENATEEAVRKIKSPRILHLATHGFFVDSSELKVDTVTSAYSMVGSGLALAGANQAEGLAIEGTNDGLLSALEVSGMDFTGTELVVLSACDTAVGQTTFGQGVIGLRRAFMLAGAQALLGTLWPIEDQSTAKFMESFYRQIQSNSPLRALNKVQRNTIEQLTSEFGFADPRLWAPFVLQVSGEIKQQ